MTLLGSSPYGLHPAGVNDDLTTVVLAEGYEAGDVALFLWRAGDDQGALQKVFGVPMSERKPGQKVALNGISGAYPVAPDGILMQCTLFDDRGGLAYLAAGHPDDVRPVEIVGAVHSGNGEFEGLHHLRGDRYLVVYNIDGATWAYEGTFSKDALRMTLGPVICGDGPLSRRRGRGVDPLRRRERRLCRRASQPPPRRPRYSWSSRSTRCPASATGETGKRVSQLTRNRVLGIPENLLALGEDAGFTSHDGLQVPARLYLPVAGVGLRRQAPGGRVHPRRAAGPGAAGLHVVLHAAHPVPDAERPGGLRAQRARQSRLWARTTPSGWIAIGAARTGSTRWPVSPA